MTLEELARPHALRNRAEYGSADAKAVFSKVIRESPEAKADPKKALVLVQKLVEEVNTLSATQLENELSKLAPLERKQAPTESKFDLPNLIPGQVVTRFLPEPNFILHIGHAKAAWLSRTLADQNQGRCLLRFDDTNPEAEKAEYVDKIQESIQWLGLRFDSTGYTSDKMSQFYSYAEQLFKQGDLYACHCTKEEMSKGRTEGKACAHRTRTVEENLDLWKKMLNRGVKEGEAIVRLKADMQSLNTVMRDPTMFRIVAAPHYRQGDKYWAWPTYDFEVSIADSLDGVTHALRSKEYELRDELYYLILDKLGLRKPFVYDYSRLNIKGTQLSKRKLKALFEAGQLSDWDDPRLPTLIGLRRRGLLPQAIKSFVLSFGLSKVESEPSWEALLVENRKLLDPIAPRYHFVKDPVKLVVDNAPADLKQVTIANHPEKKELGERTVAITNEFYIPIADAQALENGEVFRLRDVYNITLMDKTELGKGLVKGTFHSTQLIAQSKKIQWTPASASGFLPAKVLVPQELFVDGSYNPNSLRVDTGCVESALRNVPEGTSLQFLRYGFVRLDRSKEQQYIYAC